MAVLEGPPLDAGRSVWHQRPGVRHSLVFLLYVMLSLVLFGRYALPDLRHRILGGVSSDADFFVWAMRWWPAAIGHGWNPLFSRVVWAPAGYNLAWTTSTPMPGIVMAPLTAFAGPVVSFDVLLLLSPALSAWCAYLLCHRVTGAAGPSAVGGFVYGYSAFVADSMAAGHPNLSLAFLIPLCVYLVVRLIEGSLGRVPFVLLLGLVLAAQFAVFPEVFATLTLFAVLVGVLMLGLLWGRRRAVLRVAGHVVVAYAVAMALVSPLLFVMAAYPRPVKHLAPLSRLVSRAPSALVAARFVLPGRITALGGGTVAPGTIRGNSVYMGVGLLGIMVVLCLRRWGDPAVKLLAAVFAAAALVSLGTALRLGSARLVLPWRYLGSLPLLRRAAPGRCVVYAFLALAVAASMWLSERPRSRLRWAAAAVAVALVVPSPSASLWSGRVDAPALFTSGRFHDYVGPDQTILAIGPRVGSPMLWQAEADMGYVQASGYLGGLPPDYAGSGLEKKLVAGTLAPSQRPAVQAFLEAHRIAAIVVGQRSAEFEASLGALLGVAPTFRDGVAVFPIPPEGLPSFEA